MKPSLVFSSTQISLLLILINLIVFGRVVGFEFVNIDDSVYVFNIHIQKGLTLEGLRLAFSVDQNFSGSLNWISHMVDIELFGFNPAGHHLSSLLLHIINTLLFFMLMARWTENRWASVLAAVLFAIHPLRVESVAWISDRKDLLCMFFTLITLEAYRRYARTPNRRNYLVVSAFFILALLSKPVIVTLPLVLLLLDYWPHQRLGKGNFDIFFWMKNAGPMVLEKLPLLMLSGIFSWWAYQAQALHNIMVSTEGLPWAARLANVPVNYLRYLAKTFWPADLAVFYPLNWQMVPLWQTVGSVMILIGITVWVLKICRRFPYLLVGWFWFLITLVPVIGVVKAGFHEIADRYTYLPLIGLILMVSLGWSQLVAGFPKRSSYIRSATGGVLLILATVTWFQVSVWKNSITLFRHVVEHTENNALAHNNLGHGLMIWGELEEGIPHFRQALKIFPGYTLAWLNIGTAHKRLNQIPQAIEAYKKVLELEPDHVVVHFELGKLYHRMGDGKNAIGHTRTAEVLLIKNYGPKFVKTIEARENLKKYYDLYSLEK